MIFTRFNIASSGTKRELTGMIPNTPNTTPGASREESKLTPPTETLLSTASSTEPRPKIISVVLREHGGVEFTDPFNVKPSQIVCFALFYFTLAFWLIW